MLTRRRFLGYSVLTPAMLAYRPLLSSAVAQESSPLRVAIIGNAYHYGANLQSIADRFLVGYPQDGDWHIPNVQVVSMYIEPRPAQVSEPASLVHRSRTAAKSQADWHPEVAQSVQPPAPLQGREAPRVPHEDSGPPADLSAGRSREFGFRLCADIPEALRCGGDHLAVDAVLAIVEQGDYPRNDRDQILYPRYDFFQQCVQVFEEEGRAVPYFNHESLSFSFAEAQSMVATSERLKFPLLAGSWLPLTWRLPDIDMPLGAQVQEAVMVGMAPLDGMDFDALEAMQSMLERRKGGESGVKAVQLLEGDDVWEAGESGRWSKELLSSALSRSDSPLGLTVLDGRPQDMVAAGVLPQLVKESGCILHRVQRRNARRTAHAQRRQQRFHLLGALGRRGAGLHAVFPCACSQRELHSMPGSKDRADANNWQGALSGAPYLTDQRNSGGRPALPPSPQPTSRNSSPDSKV